MTTINAEDLKNGDVIIIPATAQTEQKVIRVTSTPELTPLMVSGFGMRIKNGVDFGKETPIQFGRKVQLEIER